MDEKSLFEYAANPEKIISPEVCNYVISLLGGHISDLTETEFEKRLLASGKKVALLNTEGKTNAVAKAEWEISQEYKDWQAVVRELRKYKSWRSDIRSRFEVLMNKRTY